MKEKERKVERRGGKREERREKKREERRGRKRDEKRRESGERECGYRADLTARCLDGVVRKIQTHNF